MDEELEKNVTQKEKHSMYSYKWIFSCKVKDKHVIIHRPKEAAIQEGSREVHLDFPGKEK